MDVQSRDSGYIGQRILNLKLPGRLKSITEKADDVVKEYMRVTGVTG